MEQRSGSRGDTRPGRCFFSHLCEIVIDVHDCVAVECVRCGMMLHRSNKVGMVMARLPKVECFETLSEAGEFVSLMARPILVSFRPNDKGPVVVGRLHPNGRFEDLSGIYARLGGTVLGVSKENVPEGVQASIPEGNSRKR